uniref:Uncharacterized protein n=1 Tax=viral metagenome TaxID=1070528 RepID=A0A6C0KDE0_9ZZZZ
MSYSNLPYVVRVRVVYGCDQRKTLEFPPWRGIENEIDSKGNVDLFSDMLTKLIPLAWGDEDCELYAARLVKIPCVKEEYIGSLLEEFACDSYTEYCAETKTPSPKRGAELVFFMDTINAEVDNLLSPIPKRRTRY